MRRREGHARLLVAAVAASVLGALAYTGPAARAADPPHWSGASLTVDCTSQCHTPHQAAGGALTSVAGNVNLCQSCHNGTGLASGLPLNNADKAVPGSTGTSHGFGVAALNAGVGAQSPLSQEMALRIMDGGVVCSTCHNQHATGASFGGASRISPARKITANGSTGTVTSGGTLTGSSGYWYLLEITTPGAAGAARFRWSKDNGTTWMATNVLASTTAVALDNGVSVSFSAAGSFASAERFELSAAFPFLRAGIDEGDNTTGARFCRDCHRDWAMDHAGARTYTGAYRSHPVGVSLNANAAGYDRATPLDGNGLAQGGAGDGNATNDLRLDAGGRVQCLSCHGVHYADGNTLTVDRPQ